MLEKAEKRISKTGQKNYRLHLGDCKHLSFEEGAFDILMNQYLFDILPGEDFVPILLEFKRVLKEGGRIVLVNMTKGGKWAHPFYEGLYKLKPPFLAGCRGMLLQPFLENLGFTPLEGLSIYAGDGRNRKHHVLIEGGGQNPALSNGVHLL